MSVGRPLRFLGLALGGWVMIRMALLLPEVASLPPSDVIPRVLDALVPKVAAAVLGRSRVPPWASSVPNVAVALPMVVKSLPRQASTIPAPLLLARAVPDPSRVASPQAPQTYAIPSPVAPPFIARGPSRLSGSAWLVARVATPLKGAGQEAALGMEWQPTRLPIRLVAEQRFALDGGRGGPTIGAIGGYGPADVAPGLRLEAYGQAGAIGRDGIEGFVDASARLTHPLGKLAGANVDIGVGAWGSAQRDAERFDIGPSVVATLPVARKTIRLTLDWRERIAGGARPGSGLALSIGSDF